MTSFKVVCIDSTNRPNEIPVNLWVEKDEVYEVIQMDYLNIQNRILGVKLAEKNIDNCFPYQYFALTRFRPYTEDDAKAIDAVEKLLREINIEELEYAQI